MKLTKDIWEDLIKLIAITHDLNPEPASAFANGFKPILQPFDILLSPCTDSVFSKIHQSLHYWSRENKYRENFNYVKKNAGFISKYNIARFSWILKEEVIEKYM